MGLSIIGTVAFDNIKTPFGEEQDILGGSATHASMAARFFGPVSLISVVGDDFAAAQMQQLEQAQINTDGIVVLPGAKTFRWSGYYEYDMNQAHTLETQLNVLLTFQVKVPKAQQNDQFVFLGNLDPEIQGQILDQFHDPKFVALDTMNFWIQSKKPQLLKIMSRVNLLILNDAEARQLTGLPNLVKAARKLIQLGPQWILIKRGEHGATLFSEKSFFSVPAYPLEDVFDPTGAGDACAGGFMGFLSKSYRFDEAHLRQAVVAGSCLASFIVEDFGCRRLQRLSADEIADRIQEFIRFSQVDFAVSLSEVHYNNS